MTVEELDALEEDLRKRRAVTYANQAKVWEFNKAWQKRHNRTFGQACQQSWRGNRLPAHGGRYHKALDRWVEAQNAGRTDRPGGVST